MNATNWKEITGSLAAKFIPRISPVRNLLAAVSSIYKRQIAPPKFIYGGNYVLSASDSGRILYLGATTFIAVPPGLPADFRVSLRNSTATVLGIGRVVGARLFAFSLSGPLVEASEYNLLAAGTAEICITAPDMAQVYGSVGQP